MPLSKKEIESYYLERFKELLPGFPSGMVIPTEEPDFLVETPSGHVGIELTELHVAASPGSVPVQASLAMRQRTVDRAQAIYAAGGHPPIRCTVFMSNEHIHKSEVEDLATAIASIAIKNLPPGYGSVREDYNWLNRDYFPERIHSVAVHRLDAITRTHFNCPGAVWVPHLVTEDIERAIGPKGGKYSAYRTRCAEAWLVVCADTTTMSTWFEFEPPALCATYRAPFERVFVMRQFGSLLHELTIAPSGT
jgi:hypothetical protein